MNWLQLRTTRWQHFALYVQASDQPQIVSDEAHMQVDQQRNNGVMRVVHVTCGIADDSAELVCW